MEAAQVLVSHVFTHSCGGSGTNSPFISEKQKKHIFELASRVCYRQFDRNRADQRPPGPAGFWLWPGPLGLAAGLLPACSRSESCCLAPSSFHLLSVHFRQQLLKLIHTYDFCLVAYLCFKPEENLQWHTIVWLCCPLVVAWCQGEFVSVWRVHRIVPPFS